MSNDALIQLGGRLHPLVLHLPIGLFAALVFFELLAVVRKKPIDPMVRGSLAWITAIAAAVAVGSGLLLSREDAYSGETLNNHKLLGIAVAIGALLMALCTRKTSLRVAYGLLLIVTGGILIPAGHLGSSMTHGEDFLTAPFALKPTRQAAGSEVVAAVGGGAYAAEIVPILSDKCYSCHGASKHKGGLALHTPEKIQLGGEFGPVLIAGDAPASELVRRMRLPLDDEDHMPPKSKAQPTEAEIAAIERWIAAGAVFSGSGGDAVPTAATPPPVPPAPKVELPPSAALVALEAAQVHAEFVEPGKGLLWVDFAAVTSTDDARAKALLAPLKNFIADLSLAKTNTGDEVLALVGEMRNLHALDISGTHCTSGGLRTLAALSKLEELKLTRTKLDDAAVEAISGIPSLKRVYLWNSGVSAEAASKLHAANAGLLVDIGAPAGAEPVETEAAIKFSSEAPPPGAAVAQASLTPVNSKCPVSGAAIDPKFAIVHEGKVIGFCCQDCAAKFWAEPAKYPLAKQ